jgi:hypothetical protein
MNSLQSPNQITTNPNHLRKISRRKGMRPVTAVALATVFTLSGCQNDKANPVYKLTHTPSISASPSIEKRPLSKLDLCPLMPTQLAAHALGKNIAAKDVHCTSNQQGLAGGPSAKWEAKNGDMYFIANVHSGDKTSTYSANTPDARISHIDGHLVVSTEQDEIAGTYTRADKSDTISIEGFAGGGAEALPSDALTRNQLFAGALLHQVFANAVS